MKICVLGGGNGAFTAADLAFKDSNVLNLCESPKY